MARCFPDRPPAGTPESERIVFAALARLPDPWRVIHSVAWQSAADGTSGDGEADFVLVHPDHGLLVVEVKGGGISVEAGRWFSHGRDGSHEIRNPFEQATASKHTLVRYLRAARPDLPFIPAGHAVAFPQVRAVGNLGPGAPAELTLVAADLEDPAAALGRIVGHARLDGAGLDADQVEAMVALLAPTTEVRRTLADDVADARARLIHLTDEQMRFLDFCRRQRRALITGGAGTGKTLLAIERARRLAADGFRVLLTCFNRPLADFLAVEVPATTQVLVYNFASLGRWLIARAGRPFPDDPPQEWWDDEMPGLLVEAADVIGFDVDAVVVDEGQDFLGPWFTALQWLLTDPDDGPMYVFADSHQSIYRPGWQPPFPSEPFELTVNCRNTRPIAELVAGVFGDEPVTRGADGPAPEIVAAEPAWTRETVLGILGGWLDQGLDPGQVAVVCQHRAVADDLRSQQVAGHRLVPLGGGGIVCETIHRFKGLEADAVVAVLDSVDSEQAKMLAYVGMSRARSVLAVVATPAVAAELRRR